VRIFPHLTVALPVNRLAFNNKALFRSFSDTGFIQEELAIAKE
jgi:hypothetical protein